MSKQHVPAINSSNCQSITRHRIYAALRRAGLLPAAAYSLAYLQLNPSRFSVARAARAAQPVK